MIYLIQSAYIDENDNFHKALKIGYAKDLEKRLAAYNTHLPSYKLLKTREGEEELEKHLHTYFSRYRLSNYEWFEYNDDIIKEFDNITLDTILPVESIIYEPKVKKPSFANRKNKKNSELIKVFQDLYLIFQTTNSDINKIIKDELEKIDLRLYNKKHIDNWKEFYNSFTITLKNKIKKIIEEQEQLNSLSLTCLPSYIILPITNTEYDLISEDEFIEKLKNLKKVYFDKESLLIDQFLNEFSQDKNFERRMKLYCDFLNIYPNYSEILKTNSKIPRDYSLYYSIIGPERIKSVSYIESNIRNIIDQVLKRDELSGVILHTFFVGNKYTKKYIKEKLQEIYNQLNIKKVAKITILDEYFEVKRARISTNIAGKYDEGLEIIQLK